MANDFVGKKIGNITFISAAEASKQAVQAMKDGRLGGIKRDKDGNIENKRLKHHKCYLCGGRFGGLYGLFIFIQHQEHPFCYSCAEEALKEKIKRKTK